MLLRDLQILASLDMIKVNARMFPGSGLASTSFSSAYIYCIAFVLGKNYKQSCNKYRLQTVDTDIMQMNHKQTKKLSPQM